MKMLSYRRSAAAEHHATADVAHSCATASKGALTTVNIALFFSAIHKNQAGAFP
jgi:hypothetical protein